MGVEGDAVVEVVISVGGNDRGDGLVGLLQIPLAGGLGGVVGVVGPADDGVAIGAVAMGVVPCKGGGLVLYGPEVACLDKSPQLAVVLVIYGHEL